MFGGASLELARLVRPLSPPVLILSLPRSGSSWLGEVLGKAENALYLREPLNQSYLAVHESPTVFDVVPENPPGIYQRAAENAFSGFPVFRHPSPDWIVPDPGQWSLSSRRRRRLVIKEVNPLAGAWLLRYRPRLVFLVRHPAAVALSYRKLGWWDSEEGGWDQPACWRAHGQYQAAILHEALARLADYTDLRFIRYEDLCSEPVRLYRQLYEFAGLEWSGRVEELIRARSSGGDEDDAYGTARNSQHMRQAWRTRLARGEGEEIRRGFLSFDLPWYASGEDW